MRKIVNYRHPGNKWWRRLNMIGCDHIPFLLILSSIAYKKFNLLLTGTVGTSKTTFCENLARALGKKFKTFDSDKLSPEYLQGDLNSEYMLRVPNAINSLTETLVKTSNGILASLSGLIKKLNVVPTPKLSTDDKIYVNGVTDYPNGFIIFDEVKRADPKQQALILNIGSNRVFDGRDVKSYITYCTNTQYAELYEFSEALLSRMNLIIQFPDIKDMSSEERNLMIESTNMAGDEVSVDNELIEKFELLSKELCPSWENATDHGNEVVEPKWDQTLLKEIKRFVHYLSAPLIQSVPHKVTTRYLKNTIRIFYIYFKALEIMEGRKFLDLDKEEIRNAYFSIFPYTMFLEDLNENQRAQIDNACFLAFANAYDKTKIRLLDIVKMMPEQSAIYIIWQKFLQEITFAQEERDLVGILEFLKRVKEYCKGNEPLQYMLYKRLVHDINKNQVKVEKDILDHFVETLDGHQAKVTAFIKQENTSLQVASEKLNAEFIEKVILASTERIVSTLTYDSTLYETLLTILMALSPELAQADSAFIHRTYDDLAQVSQL